MVGLTYGPVLKIFVSSSLSRCKSHVQMSCQFARLIVEGRVDILLNQIFLK